MNYSNISPKEVRQMIRNGQITSPTTGFCDGYAQGNLVILPKNIAWDFLLFCQRNPKACPLLEVSETNSFEKFAPQSNIAKDIPKYRVYEHGNLICECTDISKYFEEHSDLVSFLIGCSFSFEYELLQAGIPIRQIEQNVNVPMYNTNISCVPAGKLSGNIVVSMRPIPNKLIPLATAITASMPKVHGMPIQIGNPQSIGIKNINKPDYGDTVNIYPDETPVFWACGVTPQNVIMNSKPDFCITHAPGHMFITDIKNIVLKY